MWAPTTLSVAASTISFNLPEGVSLSHATDAINNAMAELGVPVQVRGTFAGTANAFQDALKSQPLLIGAAIIAIYLVLGMLYESLVHPVTILSTLPSAGVGALLALMMFNTEFSIIALIGVILLIGIVKKNAIMMIDFAIARQRTTAHLTAGAAMLVSQSTVQALTGSATLTANGGALTATSTATIRARTNVVGSASTNVNVQSSSKVTSEIGNVTLTAVTGNLTVATGGRVEALSGSTLANGNVTLNAGDDVLLDATSAVFADNTLTVQGDYPVGADLDPNDGSTMDFYGDMQAELIEIRGAADNDDVWFSPHTLAGHTRILGGAGNDLIEIDQLPTLITTRDRIDDGISALVRDTVDVDGQGGSDDVFVYTHGSGSLQDHDYIVNVLDTGAKDDGFDTLTIDGTADNDIFLLRRVDYLTEGMSAPYSANTPAFVALLHGTLDQVRDSNPASRRQDVERVNYDENINSRLIVRGFAGNDYFAVDDNAAITTLDGGSDNDQFQIGQIYGAPRISTPAGSNSATVEDGDAFDTIDTTAGYISRGATFSLTALGGTGNDKFTIYSNKAELRMEGNDGNDEFVVRAFALRSGDGVSTEDRTDVLGGEGDDLIQYNINAPVGLDGGAGFDKVVVIGTEFNDNFVITEDGVYGAGLNVRYDNMESVEVDGVEGDDHFFIRSTRAGVVTTVVGGNGNDTFDVSGDVTGLIVSQDLEGLSGVINHQVTSGDDAYDGLLASGISLNVANAATSGQVVIEQTDARTMVNEQGETTDTYTVRLAAAPDAGKLVYVNVSASRTTQEEEVVGGDSMLISSDGATYNRYQVLVFDSTNWNVAQTITVNAVDDGLAEGERGYAISHSSQSTDERFNHAAIKNVLVTVQDNDKKEVVVTGTGHSNLVLEGDGTTQITDTYTVQLGAPVVSRDVVVTLNTDGEVTVSSGDARWNAANKTLTFNSANWMNAATITVTAVGGDGAENRMVSSITHSATAGFIGTSIGFTVVDGDTAGVFAEESDGFTQLVRDDPATGIDESQSDTYTLRLTMAPTADVTVTMLPDGQLVIPMTTTAPGAVTFTAANWWIPQTVTVSPNSAFMPDPDDQPLKFFPIESHVVNTIAGPLYINGNVGTADRSLAVAVTLPDETDEALPGAPTVIDELTAIDRLHIHNDSSLANDVGQMNAFTDSGVRVINISGLGMAGDLTLNTGTDVLPVWETFRGGITFNDVELAKVLLGQGNDTFTVNATLTTDANSRGLTIIEGGGNTSATAGDTIIVNGGGGADSSLVVYGDTSQDGLDYSGTSGVISTHGIAFDHSGNDTIDARNALNTLTIYGGAGNDTIWGSQAGDHIAGGSGDDVVRGQGGIDHIYGDNGINVDESKPNFRVLSIPSNNASSYPNHDSLTAGNDSIDGDGGDDIIFGDYGIISQTAGTLRITTTGNVTRVETTRPNDGGNDTINGNLGVDRILGGQGADSIHGNEDADIILGDSGVIEYNLDANIATVDEVRSTDTGTGGGDTIAGDDAADLLIGGAGNDSITGNLGNDVIFGDSGRVTYTGGVIAFAESIDQSIGGSDTVQGNDGDDVILGGAEGDNIQGNVGKDIILGDSGEVLYASAIVTRVTSTATGIGGTDTITGNAGDDLIIGGAAGDSITGNEDPDVIFGDSANVLFTGATLDFAESITPSIGGNDTIQGNEANDVIVGGAADDDIQGNAGNDIAFGDNAEVDFGAANAVNRISTTANGTGGTDTIRGNDGEDVLAGGTAGDAVDGGNNKDLIFGDNVSLDRGTGNNLNPRFRTLTGAQIYSTTSLTAGNVMVDSASRNDPTGLTFWENFDIQIVDHNNAVQSDPQNRFGNDYIAGGADNDQIFGQLGNDTIQGDGSITLTVSAGRDGSGNLLVSPSAEAASDGDDYIEGNGGNDTLDGGAGNDIVMANFFGMVEPMKAVARMLARRLDNVITYCRHAITNAVAEGLNSKIMAIKRRAGGYRNQANFKTVIYFYCGGLRLHP